ncbi:hypothetical protein SORBI_3003G066000 [Sorghum bicolor]|uniref:DUF674 family protein n=1 Tax=Sorghum bicolor TaxID=4558 RepID=A0A1B6Q1Q3_SORBI|nr:hypothetical protein SORBI_3003G066000 [Sorghum bicolor]
MGNAAASPAFAAPTATLTIKLLIAKEAQVVVLAEAGKDVVDFLLGLLAMPIGAVVKLLGNKDRESALAGLASLYASVQQMDAGYMQSLETRDALLNPAPAHPALIAAAGGFPSLVQPAGGKASASGGGLSLKNLSLPVFSLGGSACHCAACLAAQAQEQGSKGFVRDAVTYTVMDDLSVTPMSNISSIALLHRLGVEDLGALEEKTVKIGYQEGLEILKASLHSKTVLTDVFLVTTGNGSFAESPALPRASSRQRLPLPTAK